MLATLLGKSLELGRLAAGAGLVLTLMGLGGCRSGSHKISEPVRAAPATTKKPASPPVIAEPAAKPPPKRLASPPEPQAPPQRVMIETPDRSRWYAVEQYEPAAEPASFEATFDRSRNKIDVQTHGVTQFVIDTSRIPIDWDRLVILGIDGRNSELRRREYDRLRFKRDEYGTWVVMEP